MPKLTLILTTPLAILLSSCALAPTPPQGQICVINATSAQPYKLCFDMAKDFDSNGKLQGGVLGIKTPIQFKDLHKYWCMDSGSKESLQAYALKWKERYQTLQKDCQP